MENKKILAISLAAFLLVVFLVNLASAEFWACLEKKEVVHYCNNYKPDKTCESSNGCQLCMSSYNQGENCYIHGVWPKCLDIPQECSTENGQIDSEPPELTIESPVMNEVYNSKSILVDVKVNEKSEISFYDNIRGRVTKLCGNCLNFLGQKSFSEGENNITFRAKDDFGNTAEEEISFFIDSKKPAISRTDPRSGFVDGDFAVWFKEDNPEELKLHLGDDLIGFTEYGLDLNSCVEEGTRTLCETNVDLSSYDGKDIEYYFSLEDIAGNNVESRRRKISVDTSVPVINNLGSFWTQDGKYIYFNIIITEENLDEVSYSYVDSQGKVREVRLCSVLKDGFCQKKKTFRSGHYDLTLNVVDEAGNSIGVPVIFDV